MALMRFKGFIRFVFGRLKGFVERVYQVCVWKVERVCGRVYRAYRVYNVWVVGFRLFGLGLWVSGAFHNEGS